jgi:predicted dienelactone hydrolase
MRSFVSEDISRGHRSIAITLWYPALRPQDSTGRGATRDAPLDLSGAPYPLILSSTKVASIFAPYLVTHGFSWASVDGIDYYMPWNTQLVMQPLDILFALDQVASSPLEGLEGAIDAEHAGAIGYSFDGYNALALSGARIDPEFYLVQCASAPSMEPALGSFWIDYYCRMSDEWAQFADLAGAAITASDDGLWQPITDERIRAVMPMAPEGAWLFGDRGLAAVDRPTLIIGATEDVDCDYLREAAYIFEHLGTPGRTLISFVGRGHMMVFEPDMVARMAHFATAFFGYYLQGRQDLERYFSPDFVALHDDLAWGVYTGD